MDDYKIAGASIAMAVLVILATVIIMTTIYPDWSVEIDTTDMPKEQIRNIELWFEEVNP